MSSSELETCILDCPLCLKTYEDPRILPCQHSACEKCLSSYIKNIFDKGDQQTGLPCPVCNQKTKLKDASSFKKSLTIVALLDSKQLKAKIQKASAKKKKNSRTIGTQTDSEETHIESKERVNVINEEKHVVNRKGKAEKHLKNVNNVVEAKQAKFNNENQKPVPFNNAIKLLYFLHIDCLGKIIIINLLFVMDLLLILLIFLLPYLVLFISILDLTLNTERRLSFINALYENRIIARKWRCFFLFLNFEWLECIMGYFYMAIIYAAIFSLINTVYNAFFWGTSCN